MHDNIDKREVRISYLLNMHKLSEIKVLEKWIAPPSMVFPKSIVRWEKVGCSKSHHGKLKNYETNIFKLFLSFFILESYSNL